MKNRKIVEFVIYPRLFHSFSILYKGTYSVSFQIYHISPSNTQTYAFPFIITQPNSQDYHKKDKNEKASVHTESNFSFQTQRFDIIYEQDTKKLRTECVFRLQYEYGKQYSTYLSCKLLKKQKKKSEDQTALCTPRTQIENKCEEVDTQIIKINSIQQLNSHLRVTFPCSQFFSGVDLRICTFYQGVKLFKGKKQLSTLLDGYDLSKCETLAVLQHQKQKKQGKQSKPHHMSFRELKDMSAEIIFSYNELQNMINEYSFWRSQIIYFRDHILTEYDLEGRKLTPFVTYEKLNYLNRGHFLSAQDVKNAYGIDRNDESLATIFQEKQLVRCNIRALREYYCILLFHEPPKKFKEAITQSQQKIQNLRQQNFIRFKTFSSQIVETQLRNKSNQDFKNMIDFCPEKIQRIPYLLIEGYQNYKPASYSNRLIPQQTLTVFVHGFQGNSFDFQKSKNYLKKHNKNTTVLIVESITQQMEKSIQQLGQKVAQEVKQYIDRSLNEFEKINFVGFSLGGVIVRSCLSQLGILRQKLGIFITFSSPHLGISESENSLVNLGVWYLIKFDKIKNLKELNFQSVKLHDSLLMRLSKCSHISSFSKVILVSSKDDGFVPLYSTFLERQLCQNQILNLCNNLRSKIRRLERVQVLFNTQHAGTLDKLTGRRGHIQFLDNHYFLDLFFKLYGPYF